jgi:hypothetical protein
MNISHPELQQLFDTTLPGNIKSTIKDFIEEMLNNDGQYNFEILWNTDQVIGGVGGYCMPASPVKNPFPGGLKRTLYRPLQYARSDMEIDVRSRARNVIQMGGMHLESVCRLYLKSRMTLGELSFGNTTLGRAVQQIDAMRQFDFDTVNGLYSYAKVYNRAKHEINQDDSKERLFNAMDAVVGYFSARILGLKILKTLNVSESNEVYEIMT